MVKSSKIDVITEPLASSFWLAILHKVLLQSEEHDREGILKELGKLMAKTFPMSPVKTLQQLESQMNAHGSDLGLGMIQLTAQQQALAIEQTRNGTCEYDFDQPLAVLMAETYLVWMKQQGANDSHITVSIESVSKDKMTFLFHVIR